jgi:26S proteasome regulatory subunit N2
MDMDKPEDEAAEKMDTDEKEVEQPAAVVEEVKDKKKKKGKKDEEPQSEVLSNLSRVVPGQLKFITFPEGSRYSPIKKVYPGMFTVANG